MIGTVQPDACTREHVAVVFFFAPEADTVFAGIATATDLPILNRLRAGQHGDARQFVMVVSQELVGRKFVADLDIYDATWAQQRGNIANGGNGIQDVFQNILGENYVEHAKLRETFLITD